MMAPMFLTQLRRVGRRGLAAALLALLPAGCSVLPEPAPAPTEYRLAVPVADHRDAGSGPVLVVENAGAASGFDTTAMRYTDGTPGLGRYRSGRWVRSPAIMVAEAAVATLAGSGRFRSVVPITDAVSGDLRLVLQVRELLHETGVGPGGQVVLKVRMTLVAHGGRVVTTDTLIAAAPSDGPGPAAMSVAADRALRSVLSALSDDVKAALSQWSERR